MTPAEYEALFGKRPPKSIEDRGAWEWLTLSLGAVSLLVSAWGLNIAFNIRDSGLANLNADVEELDSDVQLARQELELLDDQINDLNSNIAELIALDEPPEQLVDTEPSDTSATEFVTALSATSTDPSTFLEQRRYASFSTSGEAFTVNSDLLVPLIRHSRTGGCLWVDDSSNPTTMILESCDEVRDLVTAVARDEFPIFLGWHFDFTEVKDFNSEPAPRWTLCFLTESDPESRSEFLDSRYCLDELAGSGVQLDPPVLTRVTEIPVRPSTILVPAAEGFEIRTLGEDDPGAYCIAVDVETNAIGKGTGETCQSADAWSLELGQWMFYRSR